MDDVSYDELDDSTMPRTMIVVTIEGLGTNLVGCYGASICPTPFWDAFASKAIVFDQFWSDALSPVNILESMWTGSHFASRCGTASEDSIAYNTKREFSNSGEFGNDDGADRPSDLFTHAMLVTDSDEAASNVADELFGDVAVLQDDLDELQPSTAFASLLEKALGVWAERMDEFPILWIHSRGLNGPWDAPYEFRQMMCDEGDPDPPTDTDPPNLRVATDTDPDEVFGHACAAGGQAIAFDAAWEWLEDAIEQLGIAEHCMLALAGVDGYPIGEHGWVGPRGDSLYGERLHVPLIVRPGHSMPLGIRVPQIVQPHSLLELWNAWWNDESFSIDDPALVDGLFAPDAPTQWPVNRQYALSIHKDQTHLVVPGWSGRWYKNIAHATNEHAHETTGLFATEEHVELYAFPDDRWQQNEIAMRAVVVAESLTTARNQILNNFQSQSTDQSVTLDEQLITPDR